VLKPEAYEELKQRYSKTVYEQKKDKQPKPKPKKGLWQKMKDIFNFDNYDTFDKSVYDESENMDAEIEDDGLIYEDLFGED